jgi:hypothetical protein
MKIYTYVYTTENGVLSKQTPWLSRTGTIQLNVVPQSLTIGSALKAASPVVRTKALMTKAGYRNWPITSYSGKQGAG